MAVLTACLLILDAGLSMLEARDDPRPPLDAESEDSNESIASDPSVNMVKAYWRSSVVWLIFLAVSWPNSNCSPPRRPVTTPTHRQSRWRTSARPCGPSVCPSSTSRVRTRTLSQGLSIHPVHPRDQRSETAYPVSGLTVYAMLRVTSLGVTTIVRSFGLHSPRV